MASDTGKIRASGTRGILSIRYYDRTGRQREESTHQTDYAEAARILANREAAVKNGVAITPQIGRFTFEDGEALIVGDYELNDQDSLAHLKRRIRIGLAPWFGRRRMATITGADLTAYARAEKQAGAANATINRELAALRRMFKLAIRDGALLHMPTFALLTEATPRKGFFEADAFQAVYRHLPTHHQPWSLLAYYSGWRVKADILTREWTKVDRVHKLIRIDAHETKNNQPRVFAYGPYADLDAAIERCWQVHQGTEAAGRIEPRVFVRMAGTWQGKPIRHARKAWITACRRAGQPGRHPHDFRRTAARNMERHGVRREVAKRLIGHETDEMYQRYAIVNEADLLEAALQQAAGLAQDAAKLARFATREATGNVSGVWTAEGELVLSEGNQGELQGELAKNGTETRKGGKAKLLIVR